MTNSISAKLKPHVIAFSNLIEDVGLTWRRGERKAPLWVAKVARHYLRSMESGSENNGLIPDIHTSCEVEGFDSMFSQLVAEKFGFKKIVIGTYVDWKKINCHIKANEVAKMNAFSCYENYSSEHGFISGVKASPVFFADQVTLARSAPVGDSVPKLVADLTNPVSLFETVLNNSADGLDLTIDELRNPSKSLTKFIRWKADRYLYSLRGRIESQTIANYMKTIYIESFICALTSRAEIPLNLEHEVNDAGRDMAAACYTLAAMGNAGSVVTASLRGSEAANSMFKKDVMVRPALVTLENGLDQEERKQKLSEIAKSHVNEILQSL